MSRSRVVGMLVPLCFAVSAACVAPQPDQTTPSSVAPLPTTTTSTTIDPPTTTTSLPEATDPESGVTASLIDGVWVFHYPTPDSGFQALLSGPLDIRGGCLIAPQFRVTVIIWPEDRMEEVEAAVKSLLAGGEANVRIGGGSINASDMDPFPLVTDRCDLPEDFSYWPGFGS